MFEEQKQEKSFDSIHAELSYYKLKYSKYKLNMKLLRESAEKSNKERVEATNQFESSSCELKKEKVLRKNFEEKLEEIIKQDYENKERIKNLEKENQEYLEIIRDYKLGIKNDSLKTEETIKDKPNNKQDFMKSSTTLKENAMKSISNKFDLEKIRKSLTIDFLEHERDSLQFKKKVQGKEEQLIKIEKILKQWTDLAENFEKVTESFCNVMGVFSNSLISDIEMFEDCPDSISLIYCLNGLMNDLISQYRIFVASIQNSFINPLKDFLVSKFSELRESRVSSIKYAEDFQQQAVKFLATKKHQIKENHRDNYNVIYRTYEFAKYDYISRINSILLYMKIDLPEKISLVIYAFLCLFKQGNDILFRVEDNVNANLEKISVKFKEKDNIIEEIKRQKMDLVRTLDTPNTVIDTKEGFLFVKTKDTNYFKKRYFKIFKGDLIYYKLKKGTEHLDLTKSFTLCNLLLSNVKKNDKDYDYSFCFEIISAANKKSFILQAETERDSEEWLSAIRNAIASSISNYNNTSSSLKKNESFSPKRDNTMDTSKNLTKSLDIFDATSEYRKNLKNNRLDLIKIIDKLTTQSKCMDCDSDNPVWCSINWLSLICIDCSGIHRSLGVQYSKIRSLKLDNMDIELLELIDSLGPENINKVIEANCKSYEKPKPTSDRAMKENFITIKYKNKGYLRSPITGLRQKSNAFEYAFKFIESENLLELLNYLKCDLIDFESLYDIEGEKIGFIHYAAKTGKFKSFKFLYCLDSNIELQDGKNLKPIDYATISKNGNIVDFILKKLEELR